MADLADAQRRAESALRRVLANAATIIRLSWSDGATAADRRNLERIKTAAADIAQDHKILRALLAALTAEGEGKTCPGCGGLGWIPAGDEQLGCIDCNGTGHAPAPPSTATALPDEEDLSPLRESAIGYLALVNQPPAPQPAPTTEGVREAFVAGAAWHEFYETGATLWTPDRENAEFEAERRYPTNEWIESPRLTAAEGRVAELESLLRECNAVCLCGCPDADHEADECGESCGHDEHECIRVAPAVLDYVNRLRSRALLPEVEAAAEAEALHPYADWHEDDGPVLWYAVPVEEPPYCGEPLCSDWPNEWNAPYDTVTGAFIDGPYAGKILKWQRLPVLPPDAALSSARAAKGGE